MHRGLLIVAAVAALVVVPAAYALLSQHGVKTTGLYEQLPAAATDGTTQYFAWTQNSRSHRNHFDAFLTRTGDPRAKLNAKGEGFIGGIDAPGRLPANRERSVQPEALQRRHADAEQSMRLASTPPTGSGSPASPATGSSSRARRAAPSSSFSTA